MPPSSLQEMHVQTVTMPPSELDMTSTASAFVPCSAFASRHRFARRLGRTPATFAFSARKSLTSSVVTALRACSTSPGYTTVLVVPTGIGASIGGYAGDALPSARLLSTVTDTLITHPNVLNGALMYWPIQNALYVEGYALDRFCSGDLQLQRPSGMRTNRIGLLLDAGMDETAKLRHLQAADAARATLGLQITKHCVTEAPIGVSYAQSSTGCNGSSGGGASWGTILRPDALLNGATRLVAAGCEAIAVVAKFPDEEEDETQLAEYRAGNGVDAIAGAEAVISHLVTRHCGVACAHAPSLAPLDVDECVSPKAAAEELGYTFLSCILVGLSRAPKLVGNNCAMGIETPPSCSVGANDVDAVVVPANAFGGAAVMELAARDDVLVVGVTGNRTVVDVAASAVGLKPGRVRYARSYCEAAGMIAAHRHGIDLSCVTGNDVTPLSGLGV